MDLKKVEFHSHLAVGDTLMMTCAVRDLKAAYPDRYLIKVDTTAQHIWDNNPYLSTFDEPDMIVKLGPKKATQASQTSGLHYANGFRVSMEDNLNLHIPQGHIKPDLHLSDAEKKDRWIEGRYWIIVAGGKPDFGTKIWPPECWQEVIHALPHVTFVQIGESKHNHPELKLPNVISLIGQTQHPDTGIRDLLKLFYHCEGSVGLVSMQMHLAAAFDKACVVVAGAREPASYEQYNHHRYLHNQGAMRCKNECENCKNLENKKCSIHPETFNDYYKNKMLCLNYDPIEPSKIFIRSCWKSLTEYCTNLQSAYEKKYPKCILMIQPTDVARALNTYYEGGALPPLKERARVRASISQPSPEEPYPVPTDKPIFKMVCNAHAFIGGERSTTWIMRNMIEAGYHVQLVPTKGVCDEFKRNIPGVEITNKITEQCDIFMIYANDMSFGFEKEEYTSRMEKVKADRKILMLNYKLGGAGKAEWTKRFDLYGFLCSQMRDDFLKRVPEANCFVLPPAVDILPFLSENVKYNQTLHLVRHSSQGDSKHPTDTAELINSIHEFNPNVVFSFMPAPSFLDNGVKKVHRLKVNEIPVVDFLKRGSCFWYRLPENYSDQGPRTIVEAMAIGLPVIADNRWGAKDRVTPETGWLCDSTEDYINIIKGLNHKVLAEKGLAAKEYASLNFDPQNWIRTIIGS
jgi:ADP-heptose:LPS heptosyltransferase